MNIITGLSVDALRASPSRFGAQCKT